MNSWEDDSKEALLTTDLHAVRVLFAAVIRTLSKYTPFQPAHVLSRLFATSTFAKLKILVEFGK